MDENVEDSCRFKWLEIVGLLGGMMQFNVGFPKNLLRYIALICLIKYVFTFVDLLNRPADQAIQTSPDYKGVFKYASLFCRLIEFCHIINKFLWYQFKSSDMENLLKTIVQRQIEISSKVKYFSWLQYVIPFWGFLCVLLVEHCVFVDYDDKFEYTISWGYANIIILLEYCFVEGINQSMRKKFFTLKKRLACIKKDIINCEQSGTWRKLNIMEDLMNAELEIKISKIRELSRCHSTLVETSVEISRMFSFNILLTLLVILCNTINGLYNIVTHLDTPDYYKETLCRSSIWILFQTYISIIIIRSWNSLANEANNSTIILHEIYNKYILRQADGQLNYLQFIVLKFHTTKLKFTADGFFELDLKYFYSVVSCVTTYVIILVQIEYPN